jgi:hypothetical protein
VVGRRFAVACAFVAAACGARTGFEVVPVDETSDGGLDASFDARRDGPTDAPVDVVLPDATRRSDCADAGITYIYTLTSDEHIYSFDPPSSTFTHVGPLSCPSPPNTRPNSMGVDRKGTAYVSYDDGSLYRVSTANAACAATTFVPGQDGWGKYGMGFSGITNGPRETLYVAEANYNTPSKGLATIDTMSYAFNLVGPFSTPLGDAVELTGTGDGRLYGFFLANPGPGGFLAEIDKSNAAILSMTGLPIGSSSASFAFAFWGGDFYFFIASSSTSPTTVTRYRPSDKSLVDVAMLSSPVVGAGVSTCAPQ